MADLPIHIMELYCERFSEIPLVITDPDGVITGANRAFHKRFGLSESPAGQPISSFMQIDMSMKDPMFHDTRRNILADLITATYFYHGEEHNLRGHLFFDETQYVVIFDIFKQHDVEILEQVTRLNLEMSSMTRNYSKRYRVMDKQSKVNQELAHHDQLTGLGNRRKFMDTLTRMLEEKTPPPEESFFGVIMFDIDNFKLVNDTFGHDAGDEVLKVLSAQVLALIRNQDLPARYGGEEFIILARCDRMEHLEAMAEKLRSTFASRVIPAVGSAVTASFGITMKIPGDTEESLIKRADEALYQAKRQGKNCVVALPPGYR